MADDEISEEGRRARFAQWDKLGLDEVKQDLATGGHRLIGGPPQVRALAREWVRIKETKLAETAIEMMGLSKNPTLEALGLRSETELDRLINAASQAPHSVSTVAPAAAPSAEKPAELLTLKPGIWGMSIDLKEAGRRIRRRLQRGKNKGKG